MSSTKLEVHNIWAPEEDPAMATSYKIKNFVKTVKIGDVVPEISV